VLQPLPVELQEAWTEYPWVNEDSVDKLDEAAIRHSNDDNNHSGAPNNQAGIDSESPNNAALNLVSATPPNNIMQLSFKNPQ
jgi:hypothetical protein